MSFRRSNSRRSVRSPVECGGGESVENPNAYGLFGRYDNAPDIVEVDEHSHDNAGRVGHTHEHRLYGVDDDHPGWQTINYHHNNGGQVQYEPPPPSTQQAAYALDPSHSQQHSQPHSQTVPAAHLHTGTSPFPDHVESHGHLYGQANVSSADMYAGQALGHPYEVGSNATHGRSETILPSAYVQHEDANTPLVQHAAAPVTMSAAPSSQGHWRKATLGASPAMETTSAFDQVHGARGSAHIVQHGEQIPIRIGHLFKRPLIRQWVLQDKVYREMDDREPSQFELFFDLVLVGIIHKLADGAAEHATGLNVAKFVLCFYPAWSVWSDVRSYINVSGTDDVWQRMYVLLIMILLMGYAANATGIIIEKQEKSEVAHEAAASGVESASGEVHRRALIAVVTAVGGAIVKRSAAGGEGESAVPDLVRQIGTTSYWFADGWDVAIHGAIGFYLVAKFCRLMLFFIYGLLLPKFRKALWLNGISLVIISGTYLPIMFIDNPGLIVILICAGIVLELAMRYLVAASLQMVHGRAKHKGHKTYLPAYSLPHMMERTTLFTILVIGESIMNATYVATTGEFGAHSMFFRAALSIIIAFLLMWIYFDVDSSRTFVHGLKRHWFTSITYMNVHFPMCAALILMSSSLHTIISQEAVEEGFLWFFSLSIAVAMLTMGILGTLHKSLDRWGSSLIPKSARIGVRFVLAALFAIMPKLHHWTSVQFLGAHAALLALAVAFETFGKLGAVGRVYDPVRAEALLRQRMGKDDDEAAGTNFAMSHIPSRQHTQVTQSSYYPGTAGEVGVDDEKIRQRRFTMKSAVHRINKDAKVKSPGRRASWHEFDDLTGAERGEEDVGIESELGKLEAKDVSSGERWAYVAT